MIDGETYPCIDIYDLLKTPSVVQRQYSEPSVGLISTQSLPNLLLVASFRLPPLKSTETKCVWSKDPGHGDRITEFAITLPSPSKGSFISDQVMTFRLQGQVEAYDTETYQGVISISQLLNISQKVIPNAWTMLAMPSHLRQVGPEQVHIEWNQWSSAASLKHSSPSSTVPQSRGTQVAEFSHCPIHSQCPIHSACAVLIVRDYNQRLLRAPYGHWNRNLGHPTQNCVPSADKQLTPPAKFKVVTSPKSLRSLLFGGAIHFGLGHRIRVMDLGAFGPNVSSSRLFWDDGRHMRVVSLTEGVSLCLGS
jgi:hypothetical protein